MLFGCGKYGKFSFIEDHNEWCGAVVTTKPPLRCSGLVPGRDVRTYLSCRMKAVAVLWRAGRAIPHTIGHHLLPTTPTRPRRRCWLCKHLHIFASYIYISQLPWVRFSGPKMLSSWDLPRWWKSLFFILKKDSQAHLWVINLQFRGPLIWYFPE